MWLGSLLFIILFIKKDYMIVMSWFELVQTLIQTIPFPMDIVDEEGTILFQNQVFEDIFGTEAIGKKCWSLYRDDKAQCADCPLRRDIIVGKSESNISYGVFGGKIFDIHHTGMMFKGKKAMLEIFIDVTDSRELQDGLIKSEEQFRQLFGNMEQGFAVHKMIYDDKGNPNDFRYIMVNEAFEQLTGLKGVDVVGKTIKETVPSIEQYWIDSFGKVVKTGISGQFEGYFNFANKIFNATAYSYSKDVFAVVFYDVTKYKEDEEKLADRQKFIESILDVCPSVIYVYDLNELKIVYANKGVEDILGYSYDELLSMRGDIFKQLMHPKDYDTYINDTFPNHIKIKEKAHKHSYRMKHKNGKLIKLLATEVVYKRDEMGEPIQIIGNIVKQ
jgi:PAS domain S-box-containing protein